MRMFDFVVAVSLAFAFAGSVEMAHSADPLVREFVVPADDGYGMDDCLAEGGACAKLIADSWCQVNGMKASLRYAAAEASDITASLSKKITSRLQSPVYIVTCSN